jgi:hypothetical protein
MSSAVAGLHSRAWQRSGALLLQAWGPVSDETGNLHLSALDMPSILASSGPRILSSFTSASAARLAGTVAPGRPAEHAPAPLTVVTAFLSSRMEIVCEGSENAAGADVSPDRVTCAIPVWPATSSGAQAVAIPAVIEIAAASWDAVEVARIVLQALPAAGLLGPGPAPTGSLLPLAFKPSSLSPRPRASSQEEESDEEDEADRIANAAAGPAWSPGPAASPRCPAFQEPAGYGANGLTLQDLQGQFGCGLKEAASNLGVCVTTLKRACRSHGIARWPRRQLVRLQRALKDVDGALQVSPGVGSPTPTAVASPGLDCVASGLAAMARLKAEGCELVPRQHATTARGTRRKGRRCDPPGVPLLEAAGRAMSLSQAHAAARSPFQSTTSQLESHGGDGNPGIDFLHVLCALAQASSGVDTDGSPTGVQGPPPMVPGGPSQLLAAIAAQQQQQQELEGKAPGQPTTAAVTSWESAHGPKRVRTLGRSEPGSGELAASVYRPSDDGNSGAGTPSGFWQSSTKRASDDDGMATS